MDLVTQSVLFGISRWVHIASIVIAIGGAFALRYFVLPAANELDDSPRARFWESVRRSMFKVIVVAVVLIFVSGLINFFRALKIGATVPPTYHMIFGIKFLMAMGVFGIALGLVWPSRPANMFQRNRRLWLTMNIHMGLLIIALSAALKFLSGK